MDFVVKIRRSLLFAFFLGIVHLCAITAVILLSVPVYIKLLCMILLFISFLYYFNKYVILNSARTIVKIEHIGESWSLVNSEGNIMSAELVATYISRRLIVLRFKVSGRLFKISVPIFIDAVTAESWRQLRQRLLTKKV